MDNSKVRIFGPTVPRAALRNRESAPEGEDDRGGAELQDVLGQYSEHRLFQVRAVRRAAPIEIGAALKSMPTT